MKVRRRIGDEKYLLLMQMFHYFEDALNETDSQEDKDTGMATDPTADFIHCVGGMAAAANDVSVGDAAVSLGAVQKQLASVLQRLSNVEAAVCASEQPPSTAV